MASLARRAGAKLLRLLNAVTDPTAVLGQVQVYGKPVSGIVQAFVRLSDGTVTQITPPLGFGGAVYWGTGGDGNVTLGAGTTTITRDMFYNNLTIPAGSTMQLGTSATSTFRIFVKGTLTLDGTIQGNGSNGVANAQGGGYVGSPMAASSAGGGGQNQFAGQAGGGSTNGFPGTTLTGGAGGAGNSTAGGAGGSVTGVAAFNGGLQIPDWLILSRCSGGVSSLLNAGAGGGGGGGGGVGGALGGGGGGGGGWVCVAARRITGAGSVTANGGNGGNGAVGVGTGGGGGGGSGGIIVIMAGTSTFPTTSVVGGSGGAAGGGGGVAGSSGGAGQVFLYNLGF